MEQIFTNNSAKVNDGGAIKTECANSNCVSNVQSNTFNGNNAAIKGGAVSWNKIEPTNVTDNTFDSSGTTPNTAGWYGDNIGSIGESIQFISKEVYDANSNTKGDINSVGMTMSQNTVVSEHQSGHTIQTQYAGLFDRYGRIVKPTAPSTIECTVAFSESNGFKASLTGTASYVPQNGVASLENLILTSSPGTDQLISCTSDNLLDPATTSNMSITVRNCISGEQLKGSGACRECQGPSYYNIDPPTAVGD